MSGRAAASLLAIALSLTLALAACGSDEEEATAEAGSLLGFNEVVFPDAEGYPLLAESGASFVRVAVNWSQAEPLPGRFVWGGPDAIDAVLDEVGLEPLWVLGGAPCWASQQRCSRPEPGLSPRPEHVDDYASFAAALAERYPDSIGIEVWNEPNLPQFWRPTPQPELYRELLSATADAVHESGSEVPVVMGAPSPVSAEQSRESPEKVEFTEFTETVMAGPDAPDADAIGAHPYSLLLRDEDPVAAILRLFEEARSAAEEVAPDLPIWVTETGLTTAGRSSVSEEQQAEGLAEIFESLADAGVPVITVHRFFDQEETPLAFERGFGVVAADRVSRKPSFCALARAAGAECEAPSEPG